MGLTFKPDTDDLREAPALDIAAELIRLGATVKGFGRQDRWPEAMGSIEGCSSAIGHGV